jgi:hypothetical protein
MRKLFWLPVVAILAVNLQAASITFQVSNLGGSSYRYNYLLNGFVLGANQELDLQFDPTLYSNLTNGVGTGFDLTLLQPNNPGGLPGDYQLFTPVANPSLAGPFSVDFNYLGLGTPGNQTFLLNQFDASGVNLVSSTPGGNTSLSGGSSVVPEPATWPILALAALTGFLWHAGRRRQSAGN